MATSSKSKGSVAPIEWAKHLRPWGKRVQNGKIRRDGKEQIRKEK